MQNAKLLEGLHITLRQSLVGLLSPSLSARTLKVLDFIVFLFHSESVSILAGLCEELEAMAELNMLEVLSFGVYVSADNTEDLVGSMIQKVENVVIRPGWSALRQVRFDVSIVGGCNAKLSEALQSLPDKYLLSKVCCFRLFSFSFYYKYSITYISIFFFPAVCPVWLNFQNVNLNGSVEKL